MTPELKALIEAAEGQANDWPPSYSDWMALENLRCAYDIWRAGGYETADLLGVLAGELRGSHARHTGVFAQSTRKERQAHEAAAVARPDRVAAPEPGDFRGSLAGGGDVDAAGKTVI